MCISMKQETYIVILQEALLDSSIVYHHMNYLTHLECAVLEVY